MSVAVAVDFSVVNTPKLKPYKNHDLTRKEARNGTVEPIRKDEDVKRVADYFYKKGMYREWCMFMVGINCGLRVSDLIRLRVDDFAVERHDGTWQVRPIGSFFKLMPKKTEHERKYVEVQITRDMCKALQIYFDKVGGPNGKYQKYFETRGWLFPSERGSIITSKRTIVSQKFPGDPIDEDTFGKTMRKCGRDLNLGYPIGTHSLRKTFGYRMFRQYQSNGEGESALIQLQQIFNHSKPSITMKYIGVGSEVRRRMVANYDCGVDLDDYGESANE